MTEQHLRSTLRDVAFDVYVAGWQARDTGRPYLPAAAQDLAEETVMPIAADLVQEALEEGFQQARPATPATTRRGSSFLVLVTVGLAVGFFFWVGFVSVLHALLYGD